ncbi:unnamed protein product [Candida verbasci]|uniref:Protein transport protein SEC23 n=1 Tax=Candida verbasci TaxID=1227364 RepID=A0A9W4U1G1_9ASCO|nr:unnamed protein product [Candida verbasci]
MDFESREDKDGIRLSWSSLPKSKLQHQRNVIPMGSLYTPLNNKSDIQLLDQNCMITCRSCRSILNPYVIVKNEIWTCQICGFTNQLPPVFDAEGQRVIQPSLNPELTTVEYKTGRSSTLAPIFFYVVDTCFEENDIEVSFKQLKESLILSLSLLPEGALVGFISYGKHVRIHNLVANDNISYTFNGSKTYNLEQIQSSLGFLGLKSTPKNDNSIGFDRISSIGKRFLQPVSIVEYQLTSIIKNLVPNVLPHKEARERLNRSSGSALNIATLLLKAILGNTHAVGGHILAFIAGVCTSGPGQIVSKELKEPLRSHYDIIKSQNTKIQAPSTSSKTKSNLSFLKNAKKFYSEITQRLVNLGLSCNYFIGSYDQVGLYEMDEVCLKTGGLIVMSDSFSTAIFKQSFGKFFKRQREDEEIENDYLDMGFNATLEIKTSTDLKIQGLIGNATSLPLNKSVPVNDRMISQKSIGEGNTNSWKLCNVNPQSTYAIYFDKLDSLALASTFIQFLFHYQHPCGEMRLRVTTLCINLVPDLDEANLELGFDQEAALVLIARQYINKLQWNLGQRLSTEAEVVKQLDQILIEFCTKFATYTVGMIDSFRLSQKFALFPQFLYHLRRSPFINVFNSSPDETSYVRHIFMHDDLANSLLMIQPTLLSYDVNTWGSTTEETNEILNEPEPVLLDSLSLGHSKILLLDTFFQILIYHGSQIADWRKAGYHEQEEYAYFKDFLEAPKKEAMLLLMDRFPLPRFIDCDEGGSQARFLMAKLNPSTSYATNVNHFYGFGDRSDVFTDDISLSSYLDHITRIAVMKSK